MNYETIKWSLIALFALLFGKIIWIQFILFIEYMFNSKSSWYNKQVEKPRIYFFIIALISFRFSIYFLSKCEGEFLDYKNLKYSIGIVLLLAIPLAISIFIWSKKFKDNFIKEIKEFLEELNKPLCFKKNLDIEAMVREAIDTQQIFDKTSRESYRAFLENREVKSKINLIIGSYKSKIPTYVPLFELFHNIYEGGVYELNKKNKKELFYIITSNFTKDSNVITETNIRSSYNTWSRKIDRKLKDANKS